VSLARRPGRTDISQDAFAVAPHSALAFGVTFGAFQWSLTVLPVAAKYAMMSVPAFIMLESGFTAVQFAVVAPLIALASRESA
jgi:hypothetical protein